MLDGSPRASVEHLHDFLGGLLPHRLCIPCLAKLFEQPEPPIRQAPDVLASRLESQTDECWNCAETRQTHGIHESAA